MSSEEIEKLQQKLAAARSERDAWEGRSKEHFEMASIMVQSLERQLAKLLADDR